jgi:hypothetical protein
MLAVKMSVVFVITIEGLSKLGYTFKQLAMS